MGTVDTMAAVLTMWTAISVVLVVAWNVHAGRRRLSFVIAEPRSHVQVVEHLAPVISLDAHRRSA